MAAAAAVRPVAAKSTDEQLREREAASHDGFKLLSNSGDQKLGSVSGRHLKYITRCLGGGKDHNRRLHGGTSGS